MILVVSEKNSGRIAWRKKIGPMTRLIPFLAVLVMATAACKSDQEKIGALITHIKSNVNEFNGNYEIFADARALSRYGSKALPVLVKEFETSSPNFRLDLTMALALIPAPQRDEVFINYLERQTEKKDNEDEALADSIMIGVLSSVKKTRAIPVIRKLAAAPQTPGRIRASAIAALNSFGEPLPPLKSMTIQCTTPALAVKLQQPEFREGRAALQAMCDQVFHDQISQPTTGSLLLYQAETAKENYYSIRHIGSTCFLTSTTQQIFRQLDRNEHPNCIFEGTNWRSCFSFLNDQDAVVFAFRSVDPTHIGYLGRLVKRNGQWLVTEWQYILYDEDPTVP